MDFFDKNLEEKTVCQEDIQFLQISNRDILHNDKGHLEMHLPFRVYSHLPKNKHLAEVRLRHLKAKIEKNPKFERDYNKLMEHIFMKEIQKKSITYQMTAVDDETDRTPPRLID